MSELSNIIETPNSNPFKWEDAILLYSKQFQSHRTKYEHEFSSYKQNFVRVTDLAYHLYFLTCLLLTFLLVTLGGGSLWI